MDSILQMGFAEFQAKKAMAECGQNAEAAIEYIMTHIGEPEEFWIMEEAPAQPGKQYPNDEAGQHAAALAPLLAMAKTPSDSDNVHKEECAWSFARPTSSQGLYVSLRSFTAVGHAFLQQHRAKTGDQLYLNITSRKRPLEQAADAAEVTSVAEAINKASAGAEYDTSYTLVALTDDGVVSTPLAMDLESEITPTVTTLLPGTVAKSIDGILSVKDRGAAADLAVSNPMGVCSCSGNGAGTLRRAHGRTFI